MAIIYLDIDKVKCYAKTNKLMVDISKCKSDDEITDTVINYFEMGSAILNGAVVVRQYNAIIVEIKKQIENYFQMDKKNFSYTEIPTDEYWNLKLNRDFMVFMLVDDMTLPFDYFLSREGNVGIDEYYGYNNTNEVFEVLFKPKCSLDLRSCEHEQVLKILGKDFSQFGAQRSGTDLKAFLEKCDEDYKSLNEEWEESGKKDVTIKDNISKNRENRKNRLKDNRDQIYKRLKDIIEELKEVLLIDKDKITEDELYDYYKLLVLIYYLESLGIKTDKITADNRKKNKKKKVYQTADIFDILSKPSVQLTLNWMFQSRATKSAYGLELFRCEIIKHLEIEQMRKIDEKIKKVRKCWFGLFEYTATLIDFSSLDHVFENKQFESMKQKICEYRNPINKNEEKYNFSIWELVYFHYKMFCLNCEITVSEDSLDRVLNLENPVFIEMPEKSTVPRLVQGILEKYKSTYLEYTIQNDENLLAFLENNDSFWDNMFPNLEKGSEVKNEETKIIRKNSSKKYGHYWVKKNTDTIKKVIKIIRKFKNINLSNPYSLLEVVSAAQALYEIKNNKISCSVWYRGYKGKKKKSLMALLKDIDYFCDKNGLPKKRGDVQMSYMEQVAFEYNWVAFIKRWNGYNVQKYDLLMRSFRFEIAFLDLITEKIQKIDDIDLFLNFMDNELHFNNLVVYTAQVRELESQLEKDGYQYHLSIEKSELLIEISYLFGWWKYLKECLIHFLKGSEISFKLFLPDMINEVYIRKDELNRRIHINVVDPIYKSFQSE